MVWFRVFATVYDMLRIGVSIGSNADILEIAYGFSPNYSIWITSGELYILPISSYNGELFSIWGVSSLYCFICSSYAITKGVAL